jgi:hypothetical protein
MKVKLTQNVLHKMANASKTDKKISDYTSHIQRSHSDVAMWHSEMGLSVSRDNNIAYEDCVK